MTVTKSDYWKLGDLVVQNDVLSTDDGVFLYATAPPPPGATPITAVEYEDAVEAFETAWAAAADGGQQFVDGEIAAGSALRASARAKLVAGDPLTSDEAAALTGGSA